ncbi:MAG: tetratricopeptide repeat protein [Verrucomicrobia bacterium]|nr:tetratricopeptide repeat protein [Verrucomicrobiota bacterium]
MGSKRSEKESKETWRLFEAQAAYAESIFRQAIGDMEASIAAAERSLEIKPDYAPAVLTMGSIEYQRGRPDEGARLFTTLLSLPDEHGDLWEVIDKAGDFLIQEKRYEEGLELYQAAVERFGGRALLYQGLACCAGHQGLFEKAVEVSRRALELEPDNQKFTNDFGWSLFQAGRLKEAEKVLLKAVAMDSSDELSRENLRRCKSARSE